jgi:hypothetical protein
MKTKKTYRDLINEVKSYDQIKIPHELKSPPELSFKYEKGLEKVLRSVDSINNDYGDKDSQTRDLAKNAMDLIVQLIDGGIEVRLKTKHILRMKNAKIDSLETLLNPPKKKKKGKGGGEDLDALKDTLGL